MAVQKLTPQQQRDKRSKIMLAVLGVLFLALMGFQLPKIMKAGGGGGSATPPPTGTAPATSAPAAAPSAALVSASAPATGQLVRFTRFSPKNPFAPKVTLPGPESTTTPSGGGSSSGSAGTTTTPAPPPATKAVVPKSVTVSVTQSPTNAKPAGPLVPQVPAALLLVNGKKRTLTLDAGFPKGHPLFRIASLGKDAVWIRLIGGTFQNGSSTLKLLRGHKVTLVNTNAGTRYVITMLKPTTAPAPPPKPVKSASAAQPAPTATTPTATSPTTTAPAPSG